MRAGSCWARFLAQGLADPELSEVVRRCFEAGPYRDARHRLIAALGDAPEELRERRVDHAIGMLVMSLATTEAIARRRRSGPAAGRRSGERPRRHLHRRLRGARLPHHVVRARVLTPPPRLKRRSTPCPPSSSAPGSPSASLKASTTGPTSASPSRP